MKIDYLSTVFRKLAEWGNLSGETFLHVSGRHMAVQAD